jgi:hypothetical protein
MSEPNDHPCEWGACTAAASKRVAYNRTVSGITGKVTAKGYELLAPPAPMNLCDSHILELRKQYSDVEERELE